MWLQDIQAVILGLLLSFVFKRVLFQSFFGVFQTNQTQLPLPVKVNSQK